MQAPSDDILAIILDGGRGARLYPLTTYRTKPAVPFAGKYRLIDVSISNCMNSGIYHVAVLSQFHSISLSRHISSTYPTSTFHNGCIQILTAKDENSLYQGTADAVRKQIGEIVSTDANYVLILPGDQVYRMDYTLMANFHKENNADITVAVNPVPKEEVTRFGILKRETNGQISSFVEKPKDVGTQNRFISRDDEARPFLGAMGIYMFKTRVLMDLLTNFPSYHDFGSDIIPQAIKTHSVFGFDFDGYWQDIGTIRSFYETNMALTLSDSPFSFFDPKRPIYTNSGALSGSSIEGSILIDVLLCEGCCIQATQITHSSIGLRSQIGPGTKIRDSIIFGADYYENPSIKSTDVPMGIGPNCVIEGAILDKNVRIGEGVVIKPFPRGTDVDNEIWYVRDGIVVIPKGSSILPNSRIEPFE